ncbi:hypothetical protein AAHE18_07G175500 [Arachis hypogaea]
MPISTRWSSEIKTEIKQSMIRVTSKTKMIPLFKMFAGGPIGFGKQWFSWIHLDNIVNLLYEALINPSYKG